jgi:hypothetical protein
VPAVVRRDAVELGTGVESSVVSGERQFAVHGRRDAPCRLKIYYETN